MTTAQILVEPMRWWHVPQVAELEQRLFPDDRWSAEQFWSELAQSTRRYWIATDGDRVVGYAGLFALPPDSDVQTIAVDPDFRGRGIGRLLMAQLLDSAREGGCRQMMLEVRAGNAAARALYESLGFTSISTRVGYYPNGEDAVILRCEVSDGE